MCYGFPCMFWKGDTETCSKPRGEDCPELLAQDMSPDDDDAPLRSGTSWTFCAACWKRRWKNSPAATDALRHGRRRRETT